MNCNFLNILILLIRQRYDLLNIILQRFQRKFRFLFVYLC